MSTKEKPMGFKTLQEITGYISVNDGNVLKVVCTILKVNKLPDKSVGGTPNYSVTPVVNVALLTQEEYDAVKKGDISE